MVPEPASDTDDTDTSQDADVPAPDEGWQQAHWALIATQLLRNLRPAIVPIGVVLLSSGMRGGVGQWITLGLIGVSFLVAMVISFIDWTFYNYRLTGREIEVRSGLFSRNERSIPYERIQSVDLTEAPLERIFQVVRMRVETAAGGSGEADLEIRALSRDAAVDLRGRLISARQQAKGRQSGDPGVVETADAAAGAPAAASGDPGEGELIRQLGTRELLLAGATSGRVGPALAIVGVASQFANDLVPDRLWRQIPWDGVVSAAQSIQVLAAVVLLFGVFAWLLAILTTVLTWSGFTLRMDHDQLIIQHGLLDRRRLTVPVQRVQAVRIVESMIRQPFGLAELAFDTAGIGAGGGGETASSGGVLFPLLRRNEAVGLLERILPEFVMDIDNPNLETLPTRARSRYIVAASIGWVITVAIAWIIIARFGWVSVWWPGVAFLATPGFALFGDFRYRDAGWVVDRDRLLLRWRAVGRVTVITRIRRLQYRSLTSNPLQRRARLVTFQTAVARGGGGAGYAVPHLDRDQAERLVIRLGRRGMPFRPDPEGTWPTVTTRILPVDERS